MSFGWAMFWAEIVTALMHGALRWVFVYPLVALWWLFALTCRLSAAALMWTVVGMVAPTRSTASVARRGHRRVLR